MWFPKTRSALAVLVNAAALLAGFSVTPAHALPSYARQTGHGLRRSATSAASARSSRRLA